MQVEQLRDLVIQVLEDMKALDVTVIDVRGKTSITDIMIVTSGNSDRHVKALAEAVAFQAKLDLNDVVVHVMQPKVRDFYQLERLWAMEAPAVTRVQHLP